MNAPRRHETAHAELVTRSRGGVLGVMTFLLGLGLGLFALVNFAFGSHLFSGLLSLIAGGFGLILVIAGLCIARRIYLCAACGNAVQRESRLCPTCRAILYVDHGRNFIRGLVSLAWLITIIFLLGAMFWLINR